MNTARTMLYIPWMVILGDHGIKRRVSKTSILALRKVNICISRLCTVQLGYSPWPPPPSPAPNTQIS